MPVMWQSAGLEMVGVLECWSLLETQSVGRLAVAIRNHPDIFPVNYLVDDETIVFRTNPGMKLAAAIAGDSVAFEVDEHDPESGVGWSVVVTGEAREVKRLDDLVRIEELPLTPAAPGHKNRWVRIHPLSVTGRRIPARSPQQSTHPEHQRVPPGRERSPVDDRPQDVEPSSPVPSAPLAEGIEMVWPQALQR